MNFIELSNIISVADIFFHWGSIMISISIAHHGEYDPLDGCKYNFAQLEKLMIVISIMIIVVVSFIFFVIFYSISKIFQLKTTLSHVI
jgi:hypothetical protein